MLWLEQSYLMLNKLLICITKYSVKIQAERVWFCSQSAVYFLLFLRLVRVRCCVVLSNTYTITCSCTIFNSWLTDCLITSSIVSTSRSSVYKIISRSLKIVNISIPQYFLLSQNRLRKSSLAGNKLDLSCLHCGFVCCASMKLKTAVATEDVIRDT